MTIAIVSMIRERWGGSEELWASFAAEALNEGHAVVISCYDCNGLSPKTQALLQKGARLHLRIGDIAPGLPLLLRIARRLTRIYYKIAGNPFRKLFSYKPDIVLYAGTAYSIATDYKLVETAIRHHCPFFINIQLNNEDTQPKLSAAVKEKVIHAYQKAAGLFFVSRRNKEVAEKQLGRSFPHSMVVRNPVNMPFTTAVPYPDKKPVSLAMVGNLSVIHKGQDIVLEALHASPWDVRNWQLNIYGSGPDELLLRQLVQRYKLEDRVIFHGRVADIRALWSDNHLLLMPSLMEGMPLAVVEAMLCGRAAVVTDVGGHTDWIEEGREGFIATPSAASFGAALERAWEQQHRWEEMGLQAHHKAMQLYDPQPGKTLYDHIKRSITGT